MIQIMWCATWAATFPSFIFLVEWTYSGRMMRQFRWVRSIPISFDRYMWLHSYGLRGKNGKSFGSSNIDMGRSSRLHQKIPAQNEEENEAPSSWKKTSITNFHHIKVFRWLKSFINEDRLWAESMRCMLLIDLFGKDLERRET